MGFDVSQIDAMSAALAAKAEAMAQQADQVTRTSGLQAVAIGQSSAPVDTGAHRAGIGMDILGLAHVEVGASSEYAPYLEYGTYKMAARPHVIPAVEAVVEPWQEALAQIGGDL